MALSDEVLLNVVELIQLDAKLVLDRVLNQPREAFSLALDSTQNRGPLLLWVVGYNVEKLQLCMLANCAALLQLVAPRAAADVASQRSHVEARLERHRRGLRVVLLALRPTIRQRVLQAARQQPHSILPLATHLLRSAVYRLRWKANKVTRDYGLQGEGRFQKQKSVLIARWVKQAVWLHRRLEPFTGPTTTAIDVMRRSLERLADPYGARALQPRPPARWRRLLQSSTALGRFSAGGAFFSLPELTRGARLVLRGCLWRTSPYFWVKEMPGVVHLANGARLMAERFAAQATEVAHRALDSVQHTRFLGFLSGASRIGFSVRRTAARLACEVREAVERTTRSGWRGGGGGWPPLRPN